MGLIAAAAPSVFLITTGPFVDEDDGPPISVTKSDSPSWFGCCCCCWVVDVGVVLIVAVAVVVVVVVVEVEVVEVAEVAEVVVVESIVVGFADVVVTISAAGIPVVASGFSGILFS